MTPWVAVAESEPVQSSVSAGPEQRNPVSSIKLAMVKWFIALKDSRPLPELRGCTGEPGWDVLLDLYLGELLGRKTSVTSACIASGVPPTTALRYVNALCDAGQIERDRDENDARRCWLKLAPHMREEIDRYLEATLGHALAIVKAGA